MSSIYAEFGEQPVAAPDEFAEENAAMQAFIEERRVHRARSLARRKPGSGR